VGITSAAEWKSGRRCFAMEGVGGEDVVAKDEIGISALVVSRR